MIDLSVIPAEEEIIAELGNCEVPPAAAQEHMSKGSLTLTRNRLYQQGACYLVQSNRQFAAYKKNHSHRIDAGSITGISTFRYRMIFWLLAGVGAIITGGFSLLRISLVQAAVFDYYGAAIQMVLLAMGILWVTRYFQLRKKELLVIETGKFGLGLDKSWYNEKELAIFERKLRERINSTV